MKHEMNIGVPLLEEKNDKAYGDNPAYKAYKEKTNLLVPLPWIRF